MMQKRFYRALMKRAGLVCFEIRHKETDLFIMASKNCSQEVSTWVLEARANIEEYARIHPGFLESYQPLPVDELAPEPVKQMLIAAKIANVGPMAAVAGAIAEYVAKKIKAKYSGEIIVENGGDISLFINDYVVLSIYAGKSPFSKKIGIKIRAQKGLFSICTSSGTIGHSKSFGNADAVTVIAENGAIADALATAIGNNIKSRSDINLGLKKLQEYPQVLGGVIIKKDAIGAFGSLELVPL